ncbi:MAG: hypothetical protein Q9M94_02850 [Candidatus Gracilibacteria bacterium]|nr:hypothetical protein [Candidatus Gracilibacteria bacterium]MDQ7023050.1 hypothetical protein [Candidatus Gracilibacteria bacterium]
MIYFIIIIFILALTFLFIFRNKKKKLNNYQKKEIIRLFNKIKKSESKKEKIIDFDKLYHKILKELGYKGSFGEILKKDPKEILNLNTIWELHKLRNNLVHSFNNEKEEFLEKKNKEYIKEINLILKNI